MPWIDLGASFGFEGAKNKEFAQETDTRRAGASLDLRPTSNLILSSIFSRTWASDTPRTSESSNDDLSVELSQNFRLLRGAAQRPAGRVFMRYQRQFVRNAPFLGSVRGEVDTRRTWVLNSGVSLNAF